MHKQASDPFIYRTKNTHTQSDRALSGLTLAVKDLFHISGIPTTAGNPSWAQSHLTPQKTASTVQRLLDHGAELIGKTITDELAYSLHGLNCHYGAPVNPNAPERLVGGSSSGSAAAVASNQADIGLGTDTGGSIRVPASYTGLYGLRPSHGLVATDNMVGLAPSFDTVGWMTRELATLTAVAQLFLPHSAEKPEQARFYIADTLIDEVEHADLIHASLATKNIPQSQSAKPLDHQVLKLASDSFRVLQGWEIWRTHGDWIKKTRPKFAEDIQLRFDWCKQLTEQQVQLARKQQSQIQQLISSILSHNEIILMPTTPGPAPLIDTPANELADYRNQLLGMTALAGLCGLPQLHLPLPCANQPPCGISLIGAKQQDLFLLEIANYYFKDIDHA